MTAPAFPSSVEHDLTSIVTPREGRSHAIRRRIENALTYLALFIGASVMVAPLAWMILSSLKPASEIMSFPPSWWPSSFEWGNYRDAWSGAPFDRFFLNSIFISATATLGVLATSALAGYAFTHVAFPGRHIAFAVIVATMAVPNEVTIVPLFLIMRELGWVDSYLALIVPSLASAFGIFLMRQTFSQMPRDLHEAAQLDGCGHLRYLFGIVLPLNRAALASLALLTFLGQWNSYLWPMLVTNRTALRTVQLGLRFFIDPDQGNQWGPLMAASTFVVLPTLVVFLLAQRHLVQGFASAGLKG
jgi:ABC-type glycerol-3-phosphate transport system permease component